MSNMQSKKNFQMYIAFHLGVLYRIFLNGIFTKNVIKNIDEIHFVLNMDNDKTVGSRGNNALSSISPKPPPLIAS